MFDNIVALDWAKSNMAVARLRNGAKGIKVFERESDLEYLKEYLGKLPGTKQLVFEVSGSARKLYFKLHDHADSIIACDPLKNETIKQGAKSDRIDAIKLAELARDEKLKNVYMDLSENFKLRRLTAGYEDTIKALVRCKNQKADVKDALIDSEYDRFVLECKLKEVEHGSRIRNEYDKKFKEVYKKNHDVRRQVTAPGIGETNAVKLVAIVVDASRFHNIRDYWGYCGLAKHKIMSGGKFYGTRPTRYNRTMKSIYKTAAMVAIQTAGEFKEMYDLLRTVELLPDYKARNAVARHIARISLLMFKNKTRYDPELVKKMNAAIKAV